MWFHQFKANRREKVEAVTYLAFLGSETLWTVTVTMKVKELLRE